MKTEFQRAMLLCPKKYSLYNSFMDILANCAEEVIGFDIRSKISPRQLKINAQFFRLPNNIRTELEKKFFVKVNKMILEEYNRLKPDVVFVYNSEYLLPETCKKMASESKLVFFMGDSPFYTPVNNYYLDLLKYSDLVLSPDSFWITQLNMIGITKASFFLPSIDKRSYFPVETNRMDPDINETEVLYVGNSYVNSWGYKKALLMSKFTDLNFKLYGSDMWKRWFSFFPDIENNFIKTDHIEIEKLNKMFNKAKLIPADGNPGIINGIHARVFEALGSGALPLIEFRSDVSEIIFKDLNCELPLIKNYDSVNDMAKYYLKNENERKDLASEMKIFIEKKYSPQNCADVIINKLKAH